MWRQPFIRSVTSIRWKLFRWQSIHEPWLTNPESIIGGRWNSERRPSMTMVFNIDSLMSIPGVSIPGGRRLLSGIHSFEGWLWFIRYCMTGIPGRWLHWPTVVFSLDGSYWWLPAKTLLMSECVPDVLEGRHSILIQHLTDFRYWLFNVDVRPCWPIQPTIRQYCLLKASILFAVSLMVMMTDGCVTDNCYSIRCWPPWRVQPIFIVPDIDIDYSTWTTT